MKVNSFFFFCKEFFDQLNPNFIEDERESDEIESDEILEVSDYFSDLLKSIFFFINFEKNKLE